MMFGSLTISVFLPSRTIISFARNRFLSFSTGFRPRRSLLYVPGNDTKKIKKAVTLPADVVVLDYEDGVALTKKSECRAVTKDIFGSLEFKGKESAIRINSIDTEFAAIDLESVLTNTFLPDAIMIPKIQSPEQLKWLKSETERHLLKTENQNKSLKVIGQIETPQGLFDLRPILDEALKEHKNLKFETVVFGSDDYLACIGATRTKDALELLFARQYFIMHVKGYGLQAIDMVDIDFKDIEGLQNQSIAGSKMGFTGKQVIHPAQIDVVNKCFSPTEEQIKYSEDLIMEFKQHQETGKGAFSFHGNMIDMPSVKQAMNVLNLSKLINK